jgi:hypothetical protein
MLFSMVPKMVSVIANKMREFAIEIMALNLISPFTLVYIG